MKKAANIKMTTYILDDMTDTSKILVLYILKPITEPEIRKNIWNRILTAEIEIIEQLRNQEWYELENILEDLNEEDLEPIYIYDSESYYTE